MILGHLASNITTTHQSIFIIHFIYRFRFFSVFRSHSSFHLDNGLFQNGLSIRLHDIAINGYCHTLFCLFALHKDHLTTKRKNRLSNFLKNPERMNISEEFFASFSSFHSLSALSSMKIFFQFNNPKCQSNSNMFASFFSSS